VRITAVPAVSPERLSRVVGLLLGAGVDALAIVVDPLPVVSPDANLLDRNAALTLDTPLTNKEERKLKPKRRRFPQNPYSNTASFTAYTLEPGEAKIGLGAVNVGLLPGFQLGTVPVLDVVGAFNGNAKYTFLQSRYLDGAALAQYYYVPLTTVVEAFLSGDGRTAVANASYFALGGTASLRLAKPWTLHTQLYWATPSVRGDIAFDDLPELVLPGLSLGNNAEVGLGVRADLAVLNLATDLRFNRRDSLFAWLRYPFYGSVRGKTSGSVGGAEELQNIDLILAYSDTIALRDSYSFAVGYQASWRHLEARVGVGWSAVQLTWLLQAFELSYKFGGDTRRQERAIRKGYRHLDEDEAPTPPE
jgi:hypothetical protein